MRLITSAKEYLGTKLSDWVMKSNWDKLWLRGLESRIDEDGVSEPYRQHPTVFMAIDSIATNLSATTFKLYDGPDGDEVTEGYEYDLFNKPIAYGCRFTLWEATAIFFFYYGEAFWKFLLSKGETVQTRLFYPSGIKVVNPTEIRPIIANREHVGWSINNEALALDRVLQFKKFNPFDPIRGFNPLMPLRKVLKLDINAMLYNQAFFDNHAQMAGYLSSDNKITDASYDRLVKEIEARHRGSRKAHRLGILDGGLKFQPASESHKDMEFQDQRRYNREEILGIFRCPKSLYSITDDMNYATAQSQKRLFWENTILPALRYIEEMVNAQVLSRIGNGVVGYFDYSEVPELKEDFSKKVDDAVKLFNLGIPFNEINRRLELGFDERPEWETGFISSSLIPVDLAGDASGSETSSASSPEKAGGPARLPLESEPTLSKEFV